RRRRRRRAGLADPAPFLAAGEREIDFDLRRVGKTHDFVAVEVVLLDAAILDGDLAIKSGRKPVDHAALDLRLNDRWIDHVAAINGGNNSVNTDFTLRANGYFSQLAEDGVVTLVDSNTADTAGRNRLTPITLLR